ncbi:MAG: hypothetical protein OXD44_04735 [Gammaproteobacteria bacterium]|nr:hypothetical protein [Gammaproteobacteria bacterium]
MRNNVYRQYHAEMGYSRGELLREIPNAFAPYPVAMQEDGCAAMRLDGRCAMLRISNDRSRALGSLVLPVIDVAIHFENFTEQQYQEFVDRFRIRLQRGGG